jgi:hypothetical protein
MGWYLAAGETNYNRQLGPANLAVAGLIVAEAANVWWFVRGRRAVGERRRQLLGEPIDRPGTTAGTVSAHAAPVPGTMVTVAGEGMRHYHRPECPLAAGRDWPQLSVEESLTDGRTPCGVCQP